jgi:hypothetical protein
MNKRRIEFNAEYSNPKTEVRGNLVSNKSKRTMITRETVCLLSNHENIFIKILYLLS